MTRFERESLETLLLMYEEELKQNGYKTAGNEVTPAKLEEIIHTVKLTTTFLCLQDK